MPCAQEFVCTVRASSSVPTSGSTLSTAVRSQAAGKQCLKLLNTRQCRNSCAFLRPRLVRYIAPSSARPLLARTRAHICIAMAANKEEKLAILTTLGCKYCRNTKAELSKAGIKFQEYDLSRQLDVLKKAKELTGRFSVPQVFVNGDLLGGSSETLDLLGNGKLQGMLEEAGEDPLPKDLRELVKDTKSNLQELEEKLLPQGLDMEGFKKLHEAVMQMQHGASAIDTESDGAEKKSNCQDAIQWLQKEGHASDRQAAGRQVEQMVSLGYAGRIQDDGTSASGENDQLHWIPDKPQKKGAALNGQTSWSQTLRSASEVGEGLRQIILELYDKHLSDDGKSVHYKALAEDPIFHLFVRATAELQAVDISPLSREERIAFFLNTYNVIIVHALALVGPAKNFFERLGWFSSIKYNIGGLDYSADDMEHGILRGNSPTAGSLSVLVGHPEWSKGYFKKEDPRLKQVVKDMDKRIHFALNCGAKSCPPIKLFSPDTLEEGLQSAAAAFLQGEVQVDMDKNTVWLSKIFKWYGMDFGSQDDLLHWLLDYVSDNSATALKRLLDSKSPITLKYKEYDWGQNAA